MGLINIVPVKRRRNGKYDYPSERRRQFSLLFMIPNEDGGHRQVYRKTFMEFVITKIQIEIMTRKKRSGDPTFLDSRGRSYQRKYTDEDRQNVMYHILQIPMDIGHYSRRDTKMNI